LNLFNQVGIVALNVVGQPETSEISPRDASPPDYMYDLAFDLNVDPLAARQIRSLASAKDAAVEAEDYDAAKQLKVAEKQLQTLGSQLAQLEVAKHRAVRDEDYDRAKLLKHEISGLRRRINDASRGEATANADTLLEDQRPSTPPSCSESGASTPALRRATSAKPGRNHIAIAPQSMIDSFTIPSVEQNILPPCSDTPILCSKAQQLAENEHEVVSGAQFETSSHPLGLSPIEACNHNSVLSNCQQAPDVSSQYCTALTGLPNTAELPEPEHFAAVDADSSAISAFLGEYRTRCLFSKHWALREAALAKTRLLIDESSWNQSEDLGLLCNVARIGIQDKVAQVCLTALALLDDVVHKFSAHGFKRTEVSSDLEPALGAIVTKLADNQPRLRDKAVSALISLARCQIVGADSVAEKVMDSLDRKRPPHNKWRPVATRLEFLRQFVREFGVANQDTSSEGHELSVESVIVFVEAHGCASHTFEEVRTATKYLIVDLFIASSVPDRLRLFEPFFEKLRPKQSEEYRSAIKCGKLRVIKATPPRGATPPTNSIRPLLHPVLDRDGDEEPFDRVLCATFS